MADRLAVGYWILKRTDDRSPDKPRLRLRGGGGVDCAEVGLPTAHSLLPIPKSIIRDLEEIIRREGGSRLVRQGSRGLFRIDQSDYCGTGTGEYRSERIIVSEKVDNSMQLRDLRFQNYLKDII